MAKRGTSRVVPRPRWRFITSVSDNYDNGQKRDNWGGAVGGQITFGRTGRFTQIIIGPQMAAMKSDDPRKPDAFIVAYAAAVVLLDRGRHQYHIEQRPLHFDPAGVIDEAQFRNLFIKRLTRERVVPITPP